MPSSKAKNLQILKDAGFNVPNFEVARSEDIQNNSYGISLKANKYAVRSAANIEDGSDNSFAGQFATYLNVAEKDLKAKIKSCANAIANSKSYSENKHIDTQNLKVDVIVQEMVNADFAGVIFTANPQGLLNESVITVAPGLGENVVAEKSKSTSYYYNTTDNLYYFEGDKDYLDEGTIQKLITTSKQIEETLTENLDIEFAIKDGEIFILQARPITTLKTKNPLILDNSNIVESYPGISLPLTISFAKMIYSGVFESVCRRVVKDEKELQKHKNIFKQMVGSSNGRLYYKISNWYEIIDFLPFAKKITPMWEESLGLKNTIEHKHEASFALHARVAKNFLKELKNSQKNMAWLNQKFIEVEASYRESYSDELNLEQSLDLFYQLADNLFPHWDLTLINDMYCFINVGLLKKKQGERANETISAISNLESMKPVETMILLAADKNELDTEEYQLRFADYITNYGDRNVEELKLESQTFRTNPELLEQRIEAYRKDLENLYRLAKEIRNKTNTPQKSRLAKRCASGIRNREISRLNRSRIFGMVREIMLHIGRLLAEQKAIEERNDIFYLTIEEIENYTKQAFDLRPIIKERKQEYKIFAELPSYSKLIFAEQEFDKLPRKLNAHEQKLDAKNELHGTPCSNGTVSGEVLIIESPTDQNNTAGKILVTRSTDPGWVFMLSTAKGIISERGSLLSHTAIISRELKIPSVVGVENATKLLKTGDRITLNGKTGKITIEK